MSVFEQICKQVDNNLGVEQSLLFDVVGDKSICVHKQVGDSNEYIDISEDYFDALELCEFPVDVHTHPNYNCVPSAMDIAFYLSNPEIQEAFIFGKDSYAYILFPEERESIAPVVVEKLYTDCIQEICDNYKDFEASYLSEVEACPAFLISFTDVGQDTLAEAMFTEASLQLMDKFKEFRDITFHELPENSPEKD